MTRKLPTTTSSRSEIDQFLSKARLPVARTDARLIFALDATASREATWDRACSLHAEMFDVTSELGGLAVQLCYFRGHKEFCASRWVNEPRELLKEMSGVRCAGGLTQTHHLLDHALAENKRQAIGAVVFIGDAFEEDIDASCDLAGRLGLLKVPIFVFQEGSDQSATLAFRQFAQLSGGAHCHLDSTSAATLRDLLRAVATYVAGGQAALKRIKVSSAVKRLTRHLR